MHEYIIKPKETYIDGVFLSGIGIHISGGRITALLGKADSASIPSSVKVYEMPEAKAVPGFIDLQVNGGGGILFNSQSSRGDIETVLAAHRKFGTTHILPTLITDTTENTAKFIGIIESALLQDLKGLLGLHLEGPFLSEAFKGTHRPGLFKKPGSRSFEQIRAAKGGASVMTIAPELFEPSQIEELSNQGFVLLAGHSGATIRQMGETCPQGVRGATHLFNAMLAMKGREPGIAGYALQHDDFFATVIFDGIHCHPSIIRMILATKPVSSLIAVSDAMALVGSDKTEFNLYDKTVHLRDGILLDEAGVLSGANIGLSQALEFLLSQGYSMEQVLPMFSENPARLLGLDSQLGKISEGFEASLTFLGSRCDVLGVCLAGELIPDHSKLLPR